MSYSAEISRINPACFLILLDQSINMAELLPTGISKAEAAAEIVNETLRELIVRCSKADGVRDYFEVGVLAYGAYPKGNDAIVFKDESNHGVINCLNTSQVISPISKVDKATIRVEKRKKKVSDRAGGIVEVDTFFPVWVEPYASGGSPMVIALVEAAQELALWIDSHPSSYPPVLLHISAGIANDAFPDELMEITEALKGLQTEDGAILFFNLHLSSSYDDPIKFPSVLNSKNPYSQMLFEMSSLLPNNVLERYRQYLGINCKEGSRGFLLNTKADDIVNLYNVGGRAAQCVFDFALESEPDFPSSNVERLNLMLKKFKK